MGVTRYRSIDEMPRPWSDPDDRGNLRRVAQMLAFHRELTRGTARPRGVSRYRSAEEADRDDPYRR